MTAMFDAAQFLANVCAAGRDEPVVPAEETGSGLSTKGGIAIHGSPLPTTQAINARPVTEDYYSDVPVSVYTYTLDGVLKCSDCQIPYPAGSVMTRIGSPSAYKTAAPVVCTLCFKKRYP